MSLGHKFIVYGSGPNGIEWRNIFYYSSEASITPSAAQMQAWDLAWFNTYGNAMHESFHIYQIGYSGWQGGVYTDPHGWGPVIVYPDAHTGMATGSDALPSQNAYVLLGRTNTKRVIGKKYLAGVAEAAQAAGVPNAGTMTVLNNAAGFCYASTYSMGGTALTPCVWGPTHGLVPTVSGSVSPYIGSQRKRKPGVGI